MTVELHGHEAWAARGPLVGEVFCMLTNRLDVPCEAAGPGRFRLPPVPVARGFFRVRDRDGVGLASGVIPLRRDQRQAQLTGSAPDPNPEELSRQHARFVTTDLDNTAVHLPPPVPFDVVVRRGGKPAQVSARTDCRQLHVPNHDPSAGVGCSCNAPARVLRTTTTSSARALDPRRDATHALPPVVT